MTAPDIAHADVDLFGDKPAAGSVQRVRTQADEDLANALKASTVTFAGTLKKVEVRVKPIDVDGHHFPVLCLEIEVANPIPITVRAERAFDDRGLCEKAAAALNKGQRISVASPLLGMRVFLPAVEIVQPEATEVAHA